MRTGRPKIRRRKRGDGTIYKHGRAYCGRLWVKSADGTKTRVAAFGKTEEEVREKLLRLRIDAGTAASIPAQRTLTAEFLQAWLHSVRPPTLRLATYRFYEGLVRLHIAPSVGQVALGQLSEDHIENMLARMERAGASVRLRQMARGALHKALRYAVRRGMIVKNACTFVDRPKGESRIAYALSEEQAATLLKAASNERLGDLYKLAIMTGMRQGELLALHWTDVDWKNRALSVRHTLTIDEKGEPQRTDTKTAKSRRRIDLSNDAVAILRHQERRVFGERLRAQPWVFPAVGGGPLRKEQVQRGPLRRILKAAGLPRIRFHDLRHTAATLLLSAGVHPKVVQEMLGHSSIEVTLDLYSHVTPTMQRHAADKLASLLRRASATA